MGVRYYRRGYPTEREVAQFIKQSSIRLWAVHHFVVQRYTMVKDFCQKPTGLLAHVTPDSPVGKPSGVKPTDHA